MDSLVTKIELFRKNIEEKVQCFRQGTTEERWKNLKGVVMKSAEGNVGYLKGKVARKPLLRFDLVVALTPSMRVVWT